jgi:hypothetical protein
LRRAGSLSRDPGVLIGNPDTLSSNPDALSFNPDALKFDPDALSFDAETLSFDVFHQGRGSNGLIFSNLRVIAPKRSKFAFFQTFNLQPPTLN